MEHRWRLSLYTSWSHKSGQVCHCGQVPGHQWRLQGLRHDLGHGGHREGDVGV